MLKIFIMRHLNLLNIKLFPFQCAIEEILSCYLIHTDLLGPSRIPNVIGAQ